MSNLERTSSRSRIVRPPAGHGMRTAAPPSDENEISFSFLMGVWNQWWKWLIPVSLMLAIAAAGVVMLTFNPKYRASSRIEIAEHAQWLIQPDASPKAVQFVATQIEMLRSPRVLSAALDDPALAKMPEIKSRLDPVEWLSEKGLEIEPVGQSTLIEVGFKGVEPEASANLVNAVVDKYFDIQNTQKTNRIQKVLRVMRNNKTMQAEAVARLQRHVKTLSGDLDVIPNFSGSSINMQQSNPAQDIMNQISQADFDIADLEASVNAINASLAPEDNFDASPALVQAEIAALPEVKMLRLEIQEKDALLGQIEATAKQGTASTLYINKANEVRALRGRLDTLKVTSEAQVKSKVREMDRIDIETQLKLRRTELQQKRALVKKLEDRYDAEREKLSADGSKRLEFDFASQELQRALGLFAKISEREAQMTAELGAPGRPEVYRRATANYVPVSKFPLEMLMATTLASLVLPFGIAFLWENTVRRISSAEQLEQKTNVEVIGEVSRLPARQNSRSKALGHDLGLFEESIDSLRTSLLLSNDESDMQVLAVCSAVSGEGKTSVSSQLAVSIARSTGQPILLIDGDMRAPDIHQIFEVPLSPGLADVLDGGVSLEQAINRSWSEHVHLLPAGELTKSPHKLLGTPAFRTLLDEARLWYRYIVIDTPPVLAASESLVIAKEADGTIVCAMRDFSRESHVRMAHDRLRATGAETIGTVLNGVPVRSYASRYGSYGRYGYANQASS